jgi:hypothetical protein
MSSDADWETGALERRCVHCSGESRGEVYSGREYLRVLQRLKGDEAERQAHKVEPFFWSDADLLRVRLCDECAEHLGLRKPEAGHAPSPPRLGEGRVMRKRRGRRWCRLRRFHHG